MFYKAPGDAVFKAVEGGTEVSDSAGLPAECLETMSLAPFASSVNFNGFVRYPAEQGEQFFQSMTNNTSYYRNAFTGGETTIIGAYSDACDSICRTGRLRDVYHCDGRANEVPWTMWSNTLAGRALAWPPALNSSGEGLV